MRNKLATYALKFGLVLLLLTVAMLFLVAPGTAEAYITWVTFALLCLFDGILGIVLFVKSRKELKNEEKK